MIKTALHIKSKDYTKVNQLGGKVTTGITGNPTVFVTPNPTMEEFSAANAKLTDLINAKDGSRQKNQAIIDQSIVVYNLLKALALYVDSVAQGDKAIILLSGFDCCNEPTSHSIPGKANIRRIIDGSTTHSLKVYVDALPYADRFRIEISRTPDDETSWETILDSVPSTNLEVGNLVLGDKLYVRVTGGNTHGWGIPSAYVLFVVR